MAIEHGPAHALEVVTDHRTALLGLLQQRRRESRVRAARAPANDPESLASLLVTDALVVRAEADLRWLDLCESRLTTADRRKESS
jgi:hypothetical protein